MSDPAAKGSSSASSMLSGGFDSAARGLAGLIEGVVPWLLDLGAWIFGALIGLDVVLLSALLTVGPEDVAILIGTAAFAVALPLNAVGLVWLRFLVDTKKMLDEDQRRSIQESGLQVEGQPVSDETIDTLMRRRTRSVLIFAYLMLALTFVLTVIGLTASLWHMAWWIGVLFAVALALSVVLQFAPVLAGERPRQRR